MKARVLVAIYQIIVPTDERCHDVTLRKQHLRWYKSFDLIFIFLVVCYGIQLHWNGNNYWCWEDLLLYTNSTDDETVSNCYYFDLLLYLKCSSKIQYILSHGMMSMKSKFRLRGTSKVLKLVATMYHHRICHGVGPLVDAFRSHVSRSLFKGLPWFLLPVGE